MITTTLRKPLCHQTRYTGPGQAMDSELDFPKDKFVINKTVLACLSINKEIVNVSPVSDAVSPHLIGWRAMN